MLLTGRWLVGGLHLLVLAYNVRLVYNNKHKVDVTEVGSISGRCRLLIGLSWWQGFAQMRSSVDAGTQHPCESHLCATEFGMKAISRPLRTVDHASA